MDNPLWTVFICLAYVYCVKVLGPKLMENRPAFELRGLLMIYNVFQVLFNAWLFWEVGQSGWFYNTNIFCQPVDFSDSPTAIRAMHAGYWFFISKFIDFLDTVFFILRKKSNQVTVLHVTHHGVIPVFMYPGIRFLNGGNTHVCGFINSLVHVIMYSYYLASSMGPRFQRFLKWKKYVTNCQMVQFVVVSVHSFLLFFIECDFPVAFSWWIGFNEVFFLCLFINFYRNAYREKKKTKKLNGTAPTAKILPDHEKNN